MICGNFSLMEDIVPTEIYRGHGTTETEGQVVATLCGIVERVNKLVYVRTHRAR